MLDDGKRECGPTRLPCGPVLDALEAAARHDPAPLGAVWVYAEVADDARAIEPGGGAPLSVLVPRI